MADQSVGRVGEFSLIALKYNNPDTCDLRVRVIPSDPRQAVGSGAPATFYLHSGIVALQSSYISNYLAEFGTACTQCGGRPVRNEGSSRPIYDMEMHAVTFADADAVFKIMYGITPKCVDENTVRLAHYIGADQVLKYLPRLNLTVYNVPDALWTAYSLDYKPLEELCLKKIGTFERMTNYELRCLTQPQSPEAKENIDAIRERLLKSLPDTVIVEKLSIMLIVDLDMRSTSMTKDELISTLGKYGYQQLPVKYRKYAVTLPAFRNHQDLKNILV